MIKKLGSIKIKEKEEILQLLERKAALEELMNALDSQPFSDDEKKDLSIRIESDLKKSQTAYDEWMFHFSKQYHSEVSNGERLRIDFSTSEIFTVQES